MTFALAYWILMLVWAVGGAVNVSRSGRATYSSLLEFALFLLLGWAVFGAPIR